MRIASKRARMNKRREKGCGASQMRIEKLIREKNLQEDYGGRCLGFCLLSIYLSDAGGRLGVEDVNINLEFVPFFRCIDHIF
jgi:hypothetical protein